MAIKKYRPLSPDPYVNKIKGDTEFARLAHLNDLANQVDNAIDTVIPSQVGNAGEFLTTNGINTSWQNVTLSTLSGATSTNTIDNLNNAQVWNWSTLPASTTVPALKIKTSVTGAIPLIIEGASNTWSRGVLHLVNTNSATGSGGQYSMIQALSPNMPDSHDVHFALFGTALSTRNCGIMSWRKDTSSSTNNYIKFEIFGVANILTIGANNSVGVAGAGVPTAPLDINGNRIRVRTAKTPSSATDTGNAGEICWDSSYVYVCVATNTWKRASLGTW